MSIDYKDFFTGQAFKSSKFSRAMAIAVVLFMVPLAWINPLDRQAEAYVQEGLKKALVTFAVARTANGVISLIQESTVTVGVGASATLALGQFLDPINDLVESFSNVMLAACISFGIQMALLEVGRTPAVAVGLTLVVIGWAGTLWFGRGPPAWLVKGAMIFLIARFAVPVAALGSEITYQAFLGKKHQVTQEALGMATNDLENQKAQFQGAGWKKLVDMDSWRNLYDNLKSKTEALVENAIKVMAVFIIQTIILPVFFLWLVVWLSRELVGVKLESRAPERLKEA